MQNNLGRVNNFSASRWQAGVNSRHVFQNNDSSDRQDIRWLLQQLHTANHPGALEEQVHEPIPSEEEWQNQQDPAKIQAIHQRVPEAVRPVIKSKWKASLSPGLNKLLHPKLNEV